MAATTLPLASVLRRVDASVDICNPPAVMRSPAKVDVAVPLKRVASIPPAKVEVELVPRTLRKPWKVEVPAVVPWMVVVAVEPIYRVSRMERREVEA